MVRTELQDRVLRIVLDRSKAANAMNEALQSALIAALDVADRDQHICAAVLEGDARNFSAGADLREYGDLPVPEARRRRRDMLGQTMSAVSAFSKPLIVALHGKAIGAGCMLALLADEIHAAPDALLSMPEVRVGIPTPLGVTIAMERAGPIVTRILTTSATPMSAPRALELGVVHALHDSAALSEAARTRAKELGELDAFTFAHTKRWQQARVRALISSAIDETARIANLIAA